jgi:uncharacterized protein YjbJ (UPF0337 family)
MREHPPAFYELIEDCVCGASRQYIASNPQKQKYEEVRVKGMIDKVAGNAKLRAGKLTGDTPIRAKGILQQVKCRVKSVLATQKMWCMMPRRQQYTSMLT